MSYVMPSRQLVSQADQSMVPRNDIPRSRFMQTWNHKKTGDAGFLYPFCVIEVLPGDHIKLKVSPMVRTSTPLFPIMDNQRIDTHFFFVPYRLVWTDFVRFMGQQDSPGASIAFTVPQVTSVGNGYSVGGLGDHFGLPVVGQPSAPLSVSALPWRAYNLIYNQWFRDENLVTAAFTESGNTTRDEGNYAVRRRAKSHDYFTSSLLAPQKFTSPSVNFPVTGIGFTNVAGLSGLTNFAVESDRAAGAYSFANAYVNTGDVIFESDASGNPQVFSVATVAALRSAFLIQQYLEKDSRGGTRYTERNLNHFGVRSPDMRLQRAEFIGGGSTPLQFTPIAQTAPSTGVPVGALGAAGTAVGQHTASYASTEDGVIIGLISIKSQLSYSQGIPRMWSRSVRTDFYVPSLALLSEQAVLMKEIYALGTAADNNVWGYQEPFQELRQRYSQVTGLFRPTTAGNIAQWHLSQQLASPTLGSTFIEDAPPMTRVLAAGSLANGQQYLMDIDVHMDAVRPVPTFGVPAQLGRF